MRAIVKVDYAVVVKPHPVIGGTPDSIWNISDIFGRIRVRMLHLRTEVGFKN